MKTPDGIQSGRVQKAPENFLDRDGISTVIAESKAGRRNFIRSAFAAAAAGAYAVKIGIDGVKAAIADEAAQVKLAGALRNATGATDDQIAAVEKQILKMSLATGVSDDMDSSTHVGFKGFRSTFIFLDDQIITDKA